MASSSATLPPPPAPVSRAPVDETSLIPKKLVRARPLFDPEILRRALKDSALKLNPMTLMKNPVIFVVDIGAALVLLFLVRDIATGAGGIGFELQIDLWLWFTVLFATFAEAMGETPWEGPGRIPAQDENGHDREPGPGRWTARKGLLVEAPGWRHRGLQRGRS